MASYQLPFWVWPAALTVVCLLAVLRGRDEERLAAGAVLLGWALTQLLYKALSEETQWQIFAVDCGVFAVYLLLALRSRRYWPIFIAAFKLLSLVTYLAHALDAGVSAWAHWTAQIFWSYLALFTIGYACWTAPRYAMSTEEPAGVAGATRR